jgi:hypothetical protein
MIERDALMFLQTTGEGAKTLRAKTSLIRLAYRINSISPRDNNREERTGDR